MSAEDELFREPPEAPYELGHAQLHLPASALHATYDLLQKAGGRESGLMWYGTRDDNGNGIVRYVVAPRQLMHWGNYAVSVEALTEIVHRLPEGWKPLAQIHSHPGRQVEHSTYDDEMVSSHRVLSIVFPSYGREEVPFPMGVGIHEWQNGYWHLLEDQFSRDRICLTEGDIQVEDLRW